MAVVPVVTTVGRAGAAGAVGRGALIAGCAHFVPIDDDYEDCRLSKAEPATGEDARLAPDEPQA